MNYDQEIKDLNARLFLLQEEKKKAEKARVKASVTAEEAEIAELLHDKCCHHNHTDGCGWFYEWDDWSGTSHESYLKKARKLLKACQQGEVHVITLKEIIQIMGEY